MVFEGLRNLSFVHSKGPQGITNAFYSCEKVEKTFFWFHISKTVHLQQSEGMQSSKLGMWKGSYLSKEGIQKRYLPVKTGIFKGKRLDRGAEPTLIKLCCVLPPSFILGLIIYIFFPSNSLSCMNMPQNAIYLTGFYKQLKCNKKSYDRLCFSLWGGS